MAMLLDKVVGQVLAVVDEENGIERETSSMISSCDYGYLVVGKGEKQERESQNEKRAAAKGNIRRRILWNLTSCSPSCMGKSGSWRGLD